MAELTKEEREKIYLEEKARMDSQEALIKENPEPNKKAKDGFVLALGSLIVGYLLGIPAIVYGIQGMKYANKYPKAGGKGLSIFDLVLGIITTGAYGILTIYLLTQ
jgi:hypothetical protein